jgi:16S rRNA (guanine527-N7)-methyltransferase
VDGVSRETHDRLEIFMGLVRKWSPAINLVAPGDLPDLWARHVLDSAQVFQVAPAGDTWLDMGSGGGFPGLVAAILAQERRSACRFTLVESDQRKAAFLRTAARETGCKIEVKSVRIEELPAAGSALLSARALAPLDRLLFYHLRHAGPKAVGLYQKGAQWKKEVTQARAVWHFDCEAIESATRPGAAILKVEGVSRV